jgi:hypothetical protein
MPELAARRMMAGAFAASVSAVVLLGIAVVHYSFGRRGSRLVGALFVLAAVASVALPLTARGRGTPDQRIPSSALREPPAAHDVGPRVVLLLLDGGSLEYIWPRVADGRLPNFARLLERGMSMDLATVRPTQTDPVWTAVATGMYPARNGVRSAGQYYAGADSRAVDLLPDHCLSHALVLLGFVRELPNDPDRLRGRPIWSILARAGISVGIVRWPLTYPAGLRGQRPVSSTDRVHRGLRPGRLASRNPPVSAIGVHLAGHIQRRPGYPRRPRAGAARNRSRPTLQPGCEEPAATVRSEVHGRAVRGARHRQ